MKIKFAAVALLMSASLCCSDSFGHDLLHRMLGRGGCGGCDAAPTCCDTPAPACGGRTFSVNITLPGRGILAGLRNPGCGCGSPISDCGCDTGPVSDCGYSVAPAADCGCDAGCGSASGGLLSGMFQGVRCGGCGLFKGGIGDGCGCNLMETTPCQDACSSCGAVDACGCGSGLLNGRLFTGRLRGRVSGLFSQGACGCGAPVGSDCGCSSYAPVSDCGCDSGGGLQIRNRVNGLLSRVGHQGGCGTCGSTTDCGCGGAVVANDCGCGSTTGDCGCSSRLTLRDRLHSNRIASTLRGCSSNNGCNSPCPNSGCGGACGSSAGDCGCGGTTQIVDPNYSSAPMYDGGSASSYSDGNSVIASPMIPTEAGPETLQREPATQDAIPSIEDDAVVPGAEGAYNLRKPLVDPSAFIIRNAGYRN